jgi:hypothetical protein
MSTTRKAESHGVPWEAREAYGREDPQVASTIVGTPGLAFPELLVEIELVART